MLTEKKQYKVLKKISKNENINFSEIYKDYENMNHNQRYESLEISHLLKELIDKKYVKSVSVDFAINGFPHKLGRPLITTEGSNFMEHYRKKGSLLAKIKNFTIYLFAFVGAVYSFLEILRIFGLISPK